MGADEVRAITEGAATESGNFPFHAADVRDQSSWRQGGRDLLDERDDAVHRCGHDHQARTLHGGLGRIRDGVTPGLILQF